MDIVIIAKEHKLLINGDFVCYVLEDLNIGKYPVTLVRDHPAYTLYVDRYPKWHGDMIQVGTSGTLSTNTIPLEDGITLCKYIRNNKPIYSSVSYKHVYEYILRQNEPVYISVI